MPRNITVSHSTGSERRSISDEEDGSGVQVSPASYEEDYTSEEDEGWDHLEEDDDIEPSDSASRPRGGPLKHRHHHHHVPPQAPRPDPVRRKHSRRNYEAAPRHSSHSRHRPEHSDYRERRRPQSLHSEDLDGHDDYPGYGRGPLPHHPHPGSQWGHVPPAPGGGYNPSVVSGHGMNPQYPGMQPPDQALVAFGQRDPFSPPYGGNNPFAPGQGNPFSPTSAHSMGHEEYFPPTGGRHHGGGHGRSNRSHRNSMPPMPSGHDMMAMAPSNPYMGYNQSPWGMPPGMPPGMSPPGMMPGAPPYNYYHHTPTPPPPPRHTPAAPEPAPAPAPAPMPAAAPGPPPAPPGAFPVEDERLSRLEKLIIADREARERRDMEKRRAAEDAARAAADAKRRGDEDKLLKLEQLILAQKEEQLKRDQATEANRKAEKAEAEAKIAKEAAEKKAAAEAAAKLLEAAKKAREEAEAKAKKAADEAKEAHEKALKEAKKAFEDAETAKKEAEEKSKGKEEGPKAPIKFKDAVGRKFSFPWHLCKTWKGMEELIKQAFLHVEVIGPHVHQGHYDLVGPDGDIILPQVWETTVKPDWSITMHMWPMPDPPPKPDPMAGMPGMDPGHHHGGHGHGHGHGHHAPPQKKPSKKSRNPVVKVPSHPSHPSHIQMPMPPPPPPPPIMSPPPGAFDPPMVLPLDHHLPAGVTVVPSGGSSNGSTKGSKKKAPASGFLRWTAGSSSNSKSSGKGPKKPEVVNAKVSGARASTTGNHVNTPSHAHRQPVQADPDCIIM